MCFVLEQEGEHMRVITVFEQERAPCPFCGGEVEAFVDDDDDECGIECPSCHVRVTSTYRGDTMADTYDLVLDVWNRRVQ